VGARDPFSGATAICGLGMTELGKVYGRTATDFAVDAVLRALADAGLEKRELDGLLLNAGISQGIDLSLAQTLGLGELAVLTQMNAYGSTAGQMVQYAALAVHHGLARHVACVFADAPLVEGVRAGQAYGGARARRPGLGSVVPSLGFAGPIPFYAMHAQRHMDVYGTTQDQLGAIAVGSRAWAQKNPQAQLHAPLTLADYHAAPWVVAPFHVLDCCLVSNGAICVIVSRGEGGAFVASGALGPDGALPTNTGGGMLSSFYMWGMTPISEAVIQARGEGGARQLRRNARIAVSGNGGILNHHSTLVLSPHEQS